MLAKSLVFRCFDAALFIDVIKVGHYQSDDPHCDRLAIGFVIDFIKEISER